MSRYSPAVTGLTVPSSLIYFQIPLDEVFEVRGVFLNPALYFIRLVRKFFREVGLRAGYPPVSQASGKSLFMEFEIMPVAGIPPLAAPHLKPCCRVPRKDSHRMPVFQRLPARTRPVNLVRAFLVSFGKRLILLFKRGPE